MMDEMDDDTYLEVPDGWSIERDKSSYDHRPVQERTFRIEQANPGVYSSRMNNVPFSAVIPIARDAANLKIDWSTSIPDSNGGTGLKITRLSNKKSKKKRWF